MTDKFNPMMIVELEDLMKKYKSINLTIISGWVLREYTESDGVYYMGVDGVIYKVHCVEEPPLESIANFRKIAVPILGKYLGCPDRHYFFSEDIDFVKEARTIISKYLLPVWETKGVPIYNKMY